MLTSSLLPLGEVTKSWVAGAAAMSIVTVLTVAGNAAVLAALRRARPRFPAHYPLASLAAADLMLGMFVLPLAAARELFLFKPSWAVCACWSTLDVLCSTASILSLCTLGWERWSGITAPLSRARRTKRARRFSLLIWPIAAVVAVPTAFVPSSKHGLSSENIKACSVNTNIVYVFISMTLSFYLPAGGMIFLYARILMALASVPQLRVHRGRSPCKPDAIQKPINKSNNSHDKGLDYKELPTPSTDAETKQTKDIGELILIPSIVHKPGNDAMKTVIAVPSPFKVSSNSPEGVTMPRQRRATQIIVRLMFLFLICWTPFFVMLPIDSLCGCVPSTTWQVCSWLGYMNSALDPLVYAAASPTVLRALRASMTLSTTSSTNKTPITLRAGCRKF